MTTSVLKEQGFVIALLAVTLVLAGAVPDAPAQAIGNNSIFIALLIVLAILFPAWVYLQPKNSQAVTDIFLLLSGLLLLWEVLLGKLVLFDPLLFPGPAKVFAVFGTDWEIMLKGVGSSLFILTWGYLLALAIAVPAGLYIGLRKRLFAVAYPVAKAVSPIPPTVYLPYAIVLLPTFSASSIFLIFIGSFWPIFVGTVYGVFSIDQRLINSARTLGLSEHQMVRRILLHGAMPSIFSGAMISLIMSFITITVAEMIAATSGLGWYIEYNHQFANYDKVIAGMILIALVVIAIMNLFDRIQEHCLRWQRV
jgi:NitT/TauT family transport system permease protein